jgi:hypothetical protein
MPFSQIVNGTVRADPAYSADSFLLPAYEWLEAQIGFFPHFISVGTTEEALYRTGYQDNWRRFMGSEYRQGAVQKIYRKKGEHPDHVLLSFDDLEGVFMDFMRWHIAINACTNGRPVPVRESTMILKPSWTRSRWLRAAGHSHAVDLLVPDLPLGSASGVWVRNRTAQRKMKEMGFRNVEIVRVPVDSGS